MSLNKVCDVSPRPLDQIFIYSLNIRAAKIRCDTFFLYLLMDWINSRNQLPNAFRAHREACTSCVSARRERELCVWAYSQLPCPRSGHTVCATQPTSVRRRNMDACWIDRYGDGRVQERTDGWEGEGWILTDQWEDWQPENNESVQTLFIYFVLTVTNFPGTPIFALPRSHSWILEMIYLICRILMCLHPTVIYWKLFVSFC